MHFAYAARTVMVYGGLAFIVRLAGVVGLSFADQRIVYLGGAPNNYVTRS
jgi:hypothetical protein